MKTWQFWMLFLAIAWSNVLLAGVLNYSQEIFNQTRWVTWKLDQRGSEKIMVDSQ